MYSESKQEAAVKCLCKDVLVACALNIHTDNLKTVLQCSAKCLMQVVSHKFGPHVGIILEK